MKKNQKPLSARNTPQAVLRLSAFFTGLSQAWKSPARRRSLLSALWQGALLLFVCGILTMGLVLTASLSMVHTTSDMITTIEALEPDLGAGKYDCILVLGAGVRKDGSPSEMLLDRVTVACDVYETAGEADLPILMSGDHTGDYNEVGVMKMLATEMGVPSEQVFLDHEGYSTYESIYRAKYIFGAKKLVIVTQEYHLHRALHIARELGMEAMGVSSDLRPYKLQTRYEAREMLARFKDMFTAAEGEYDNHLDLPVDLKGDGNMTN